MSQVDERGRGDEDDLQHPEANVGDGESLIITNILTTRLLSVTGEVRLLISPNLLSCCSQHQDSEDEEDSQPNLREGQSDHVL